MAADEHELKRMILQAKAEERVYANSQANNTPTPDSLAVKPTPNADDSLNLSESMSAVNR